MTIVEQEMINRFGEGRVIPYEAKTEDEVSLLMLELELQTPVTVIMTNGLAQKDMPVPEKYKDRKHCELYFCLPSYWEWEDIENPNMNWVFSAIQRLAKHLRDNDTYYNAGHTFKANREGNPISSTMKQNHFILTDPILLEQQLAPIENEDIYFFAIVPIFEDEFDWKNAKGHFKFMRRFTGKNNSEKLDDFRESIRKSRLKLF